MGAGWERLADMMRAVDLPTRGGASECFAQLDMVFAKRSRRGILVILPNNALVTFWLNRGAGRRMMKWFRSREDEDDALKYVRELNLFVCGLNGCPIGILF